MGEHDAEYWFTQAEELEEQAERLDEIEQIVAQQEKNDEAMEAYSKGLELSPTNYSALDRLLYLSRRARDRTKAEEAMKRVVAVRPKDEELLTALMWNLRGQGKKNEADSVQARIDALETTSDSGDALNREIRRFDPDPESDGLDPITKLYEEGFAEEEEQEPADNPIASVTSKPEEAERDEVVIDAILNYGRAEDTQKEESKKPDIMGMFETDEDVEEIKGGLFDTDNPVEDESEEEEDLEDLKDLFG
jgi:tetratricopeptide (TPR) repeat protein